MKKISNKNQGKIGVKYLESKSEKAITLIALVITIVLNCSFLAMV